MLETRERQYRVLVVDDNELIADTIVAILREAGFDAVASYRGDEALNLARTASFDLLLSDVVMPGTSGVELAIAVTDERCVPNVLLISGMSTTADLLEDARSHGYDFEIISKPTQPFELLKKIREQLHD